MNNFFQTFTSDYVERPQMLTYITNLFYNVTSFYSVRRCPTCRADIQLWFLHPTAVQHDTAEKQRALQKAKKDTDDLIEKIDSHDLIEAYDKNFDRIRAVIQMFNDIEVVLDVDNHVVDKNLYDHFRTQQAAFSQHLSEHDRYHQRFERLFDEPVTFESFESLHEHVSHSERFSKLLRAFFDDCMEVLELFH